MPWFSICANCAKISDDNPLIRQYLKCQTIRPSQFMIEQCTNYYIWANCIKKRLLYSMIIGCSYFGCARTPSNTSVHLCLTIECKVKAGFRTLITCVYLQTLNYSSVSLSEHCQTTEPHTRWPRSLVLVSWEMASLTPPGWLCPSENRILLPLLND